MSTSLTKSLKILMLCLMVFASSCKTEKVEEYQINDVTLYASASEKKNLKTDAQFISVLYTDLFGKSISSTELKELNKAYSSVGDKALVIDVMIKSLLANSSAIVTSNTAMRANPESFINDTYKRFMVRNPTAQEVWFLKDKILNNQSLQPIDVYYALLTSEEYRYY